MGRPTLPDASEVRPLEVCGYFRRSRFVRRLQCWVGVSLAELTAMTAVHEVHNQADYEPEEEAQPGQNRQSRHKEHAENNAEYWRCKSSRRAEAAMPLRLLVTENDHAQRNEHEGEQRADVRQVGERTDVQDTGGYANQKSRDPCRYGWRSEARMHPAEHLRQ